MTSVNVASFKRQAERRFLTGSKGDLSSSLDKLQAKLDATDPQAIADAVTKALEPLVKQLAQAEKAQGVTVHSGRTDEKYKLPSDDDDKPNEQGDVARQYQPPKSEDNHNE